MTGFTATLTVLAVIGSAFAEAQTVIITRAGTRNVRPGPAENFTGGVRVEMLFEALDPSHASGGTVSFEAGARTAWHSHPRGQILIVTAGTGRVQRWGDPMEEIRAGDVVRIAANEKHWQGASPLASMTHVAITEHRDGTAVQWMEKVGDEQYDGLPSGAAGQAKALNGELGAVAPKFVQLTNDVVYGDLWRRPDLSLRDRSLVTIAALAAMGDDDQLDFYLRRGLESGLTRDQIAEALTHVGFYAGWPKATRAIAAVTRSLGR